MLSISGRLVSKSLIKSGESEFGKWQVIQFVISKTFNKKKIMIALTAKGKLADFINTVAKNEKLRIQSILFVLFMKKQRNTIQSFVLFQLKSGHRENVLKCHLMV